MVQWIGFASVVLPFVPEERIAGKSKYSLRKMLRLAADGMFSFSLAPLRLGLLIGGVFLLLAGGGSPSLVSFFFARKTPKIGPRWRSAVLVVSLRPWFSI